MDALAGLTWSQWVEAIGWSLVHFLWQGTLFAVILAGVLHVLRSRPASARYLLCCAGMLLMAVLPVATLIVQLRAAEAPDVLAIAAASPVEGPLPLRLRVAAMLPTLTAMWAAGVLALQGRLALDWWRARQTTRLGTRPLTGPSRDALRDLCRRMGIGRPVRLLESSLVAVPMVIGWARPVILVPTSALTGLTPDQLRAVLAHELAHVRRHDFIVNIFQTVLESVLFYHPAVWWLSGRIRVEREFCCDDLAVRTCGDAVCFARALSTLDTLRDEPAHADPSPALASTGGSLMTRIARLVAPDRAGVRPNGGWFVFTAAAATAVAALAAVPFVSAAEVAEACDHAVTQAENVPAEAITVRTLVPTGDVSKEDMRAVETLMEMGLDDATLAAVLPIFGVELQTIDVSKLHERRQAMMDRHVKEIVAETKVRLANGQITEAEAKTELEHVKRMVERSRAPRRHEIAVLSGAGDATTWIAEGPLAAQPDVQHIVALERAGNVATAEVDGVLLEIAAAPGAPGQTFVIQGRGGPIADGEALHAIGNVQLGVPYTPHAPHAPHAPAEIVDFLHEGNAQIDFAFVPEPAPRQPYFIGEDGTVRKISGGQWHAAPPAPGVPARPMTAEQRAGIEAMHVKLKLRQAHEGSARNAQTTDVLSGPGPHAPKVKGTPQRRYTTTVPTTEVIRVHDAMNLWISEQPAAEQPTRPRTPEQLERDAAHAARLARLEVLERRIQALLERARAREAAEANTQTAPPTDEDVER